jgi:hypothetical protein
MTRLQTLHCAYSAENGLLKKTENSKIKTAKKGGCPEDHLGIKNRIKKIPVN